METTYFVLGMLSTIGVVIITAIVWGVVKIIKLSKEIKQEEESIKNIDRALWDMIHDLREDLNRRMDDMNRDSHEIREDLDRRMDDMDRNAHSTATDLELGIHARINDQITDAVTQSTSYTDKRIDKLIDTYFSDKKSKKELING